MPFLLNYLTKCSISIFTHFEGQNGLLVTARASGKGWINSQLLKQMRQVINRVKFFPST